MSVQSPTTANSADTLAIQQRDISTNKKGQWCSIWTIENPNRDEMVDSIRYMRELILDNRPGFEFRIVWK